MFFAHSCWQKLIIVAQLFYPVYSWQVFFPIVLITVSQFVHHKICLHLFLLRQMFFNSLWVVWVFI